MTAMIAVPNPQYHFDYSKTIRLAPFDCLIYLDILIQVASKIVFVPLNDLNDKSQNLISK